MYKMKRVAAILWIPVLAMLAPLSGQESGVPLVDHLRITELMPNPAGAPDGDLIDNDLFEFIELKNLGDTNLNLTKVAFTAGVTFTFQGSRKTSLAPGEFALIVRDEPSFLSRYGPDLSDRIAGQYTGGLSNKGERITLVDTLLGTIVDFQYDDGRGWPLGTDGAGHSLVPLTEALVQPSPSALNYAGNWRHSANRGGSPGMDDPHVAQTLVINELLANPSTGESDFVELYNCSEDPISLMGWHLSDDSNDLGKWAIGGQTTVGGLARTAFDLANAGFALSSGGEQLFLSYLPEGGPGGIRDAVRFKAQASGVSLGRYPDGQPGWFALTPSRGSANTPPIDRLIISEIMYHPADPNYEYIEIANPTDQAVLLGSPQAMWRLDGAVEYVFPLGTVIGAGERIVVLGLDPLADAAIYGRFCAAYGIDGSTTQCLGPWSGNLANDSERIAMEQALGATAVDDPEWIMVDEVIYGDQYPWPTTPDGQCDVLHRTDVSPALNSMDPAHWLAAAPTPGDE